jgi:mannan endo-1,4-beta-mannosidase
VADADVFSPPDIIAPTPPKRRGRHFGPGGPLFNVSALVVLAGISAFVVTSPSADELLAQADDAVEDATDGLVVGGRLSAPRTGGDGDDGSSDDDLEDDDLEDGGDAGGEGGGNGGWDRDAGAAPGEFVLASTASGVDGMASYGGWDRGSVPERATRSSGGGGGDLVAAPAPRRASGATSGGGTASGSGSSAARTPSSGSTPTTNRPTTTQPRPSTTAVPTTTTTAPPPPVPSKYDLMLPQNRYFGIHTREAPGWMAEVDQVADKVGKHPDLLLFFTSFSTGYPGAGINASWEKGMLPMVSWEPIIMNSEVGQPRLREIYEGEWDDYLDEWAADAAAHGAPFALRFAHEMNGNWYPWSESRNGNADGDFVKAWRHIHDRFDAAGADNVIWTWSINRVDSIRDTLLRPLYPGPEYVDWVGVSAYYRSETADRAPSFDETFARTLGALRDVAPNKAIVLSEVAAGTSESNRVVWIDDLFANMPEHADILGFIWFNDIKTSGDWRLQYSERTARAFARGIAESRYGDGRPRTPPPLPGS